MKPDVDVVMQGFLGTLFSDIAPNLTAEYAVGHVSLMAMMMFMTAHEHEVAAENGVADIRDMRALFADAATLVGVGPLADQLQAASGAGELSLRLSALRAESDKLKALLIELHEHVEESQAAWARALEARILALLSASAERHKLAMLSLG